MRALKRRRTAAAVVVISCLAACSPGLDWRELPMADAALRASFPCKPTQTVVVDRGLFHCETQGIGFSVSWIKLGDPVRLRQALLAAPQELATRLGSPARPGRNSGPTLAPAPQGALAWPETGVWQIDAEGRQAYLLVWARGLTLYQAVVRGDGFLDAAAQNFFLGLSHERLQQGKG